MRVERREETEYITRQGGGEGGLIVIMSPKVQKKSVKCYISIIEMKENNHVSEKII